MRGGTAIIAGLASAGIVLAASPADASDYGPIFTTDNDSQPGSGMASWKESTDTLTVCDRHRDGWQVRGWIYRPNVGNPSTGPTLIMTTDQVVDGRCVSKSVDIAENGVTSIKVCLFLNNQVAKCNYHSLPGRY